MDTGEGLAFVPLADDLVRDLLPDMTEEKARQHWHLVMPDGSDLVKGEAGITLLELLPLTRWLGHVLRALKLHPIVDAIDWSLGKARTKLGWSAADLPGPERYP